MSEKLDVLTQLGKGKMTYATIAVVIVLGILEGFDIYEVPATVWIMLTAAGFGFMRRGVGAIEKIIEEIRKKQE